MTEGRRGDLEFGTIPRLVRLAAERHRDRSAVDDVDEVLSFGRLEAEARRVTGALLAAGVERGDRIAIWAPNGWRWIVAALGAHAAGAALVPINTRFKGEEAAYILARSGACADPALGGGMRRTPALSRRSDSVGSRSRGRCRDTWCLRGRRRSGSSRAGRRLQRQWRPMVGRGGALPVEGTSSPAVREC